MRLKEALLAVFAMYTMLRLMGLLGAIVVFCDAVVGALALAAVVMGFEPGWRLRRGTGVAVTAALAPAVLPALFIPLTGPALNGLLRGHVFDPVLLWELGVAAASALAAEGRRPAAAAAASALVWVASRGLPRATLGGLASLALNAAAGSVVGVLASRYGALPGLVYGAVGVVVPVYVMPLLPRMPATALTMVYFVGHVVAAAYAVSQGREQTRPALALRPLLPPLAALAAIIVVMKMGYYAAVVATGSMEPALRPGDIVVIAPVSPYDLHVGDIVAYVGKDGSLVVHRLVAVKERGGTLLLYTKGDANPAEDPPFTPASLVGRVVLHIPVLGRPQLLVAKALGSVAALPLMLAALAATLAAYEAGRSRQPPP